MPCPRLVPLIESDDPFGEETIEAVREYAAPLQDAGVDTVILGCTHYPLIRPIFQRVFGRATTLVFSAEETPREVAETLARKRIENDETREGGYRFLTTGDPGQFRTMGARFLQLPIAEVEQVTLAQLGGGGVSTRRRRRPDQLRPLSIDVEFLEQPHGAVLHLGRTRGPLYGVDRGRSSALARAGAVGGSRPSTRSFRRRRASGRSARSRGGRAAARWRSSA